MTQRDRLKNNASKKNAGKVTRSRKAPAKRSQTRQPKPTQLPNDFEQWFSQRGWTVRAHQLELIDAWKKDLSTLLIAPTGAGKTLAGFLPSLIDLASSKKQSPDPKTSDSRLQRGAGLHTLYISPLKALAVDVARNLLAPIEDMALPIKTETRTGDTPVGRRARQRQSPPDILLTTPEQVALLLAHPDAPYLFADLKTVILDEVHALAGSKRGDLLSLDLACLRRLSPDVRTIGLSATVAKPSELRAFISGQRPEAKVTNLANLVHSKDGADPKIEILELNEPVPWAGHSARYAIPAIYERLTKQKLSLVFVNTRMQAELVFQELWRVNEKNLRIALHHGSLDVGKRRKVEAAMVAGTLDAVVATSTLDLGIDWGDVDLVVNIGAPKGASRLIQRVGRANHRLDEPSKALLVPGNRFELLECRAALDAAYAGTNDVMLSRTGGLDVLAQHVLGMVCQGPISAKDLYHEVTSAAPYASLPKPDFDRVIDFVSTGGYALRAYDRFAKLKTDTDNRLRLSHPKIAQAYRMNVGTIVEAPGIKLRMVSPRSAKNRPSSKRALMGGRVLGEVDEYFIEQLKPGDTFVFSGEVVCFEGMRNTDAFVSKSSATDPMIPSYAGGKFPLSTHLAERVRNMLATKSDWAAFPDQVQDWLSLQAEHSHIPSATDVLVETFPRGKRHFLVTYPFEGRLAHQTLGMLLTRRLNRAGARPLGFVANDYGLSIWCQRDLSELIASGDINMSELFAQDMLGDDLDAWMIESNLMKRTFRYTAVIAGLIERRHPGKEKSGRQVTMSTDLVYDVLRKHEPDHILLKAAWADAGQGLLDLRRLGDFLARIEGHIKHRALSRVSPLSVPILLEIGKESVAQASSDDFLREAADDLISEALTESSN